MCLVVIAHRAHAEYSLIVGGNRDEFHARPSRDVHWWPDKPDILGGRDLQAGGTWLALHRNGRFATVTNFRDAVPSVRGLRSRGHLIGDFLDGDLAPLEYLQNLEDDAYAGFNLLVADGDHLAYRSNRGGGCHELPPGVYGLANATLDTPWPKVTRSKQALFELMEAGSINETALLRLLDDRERAAAKDIDATAGCFAEAHAISSPFIVLPEYGTRCSTVVLRDKDGRTRLLEKRFDADGNSTGSSEFAFDVAG